MKDSNIIKLRTKLLSNGRKSLYLDYYKDGVRTYEYLKMYIIPETSPRDRLQNKATLEQAKTIQSRRIIELQSGKAGLLTKEQKCVSFSEYMLDYINSVACAVSVRKTFKQARNKWIEFAGEKATVNRVDIKQMIGFTTFLYNNKVKQTGRNLNPTTCRKYFDAVSKVLDRAVRDGYLPDNPVNKMISKEKPQGKSGERCFLTLDELKRMSEAECPDPMLKSAFMLACFTGLRKSDILSLTWDQVSKNGIRKMMKKTNEVVHIPLSDNAKKWLPAKKGNNLFRAKSDRQWSRDIQKWTMNAGIDKHITFHCSRHTFATLLLTYGNDIAVVSNLLGHHNISTTMIYAKIVDRRKEEAVSSIPEL